MSVSKQHMILEDTEVPGHPDLDVVHSDGPSLQEQSDASHRSCRTDRKITEIIIAHHIKALQREIAELKHDSPNLDGDEDHEMDNHQDDEDAWLIAAEYPTTTESPFSKLLQGSGPGLQDLAEASHQKSQAAWRLSEDNLLSKLNAQRVDISALERKSLQHAALEKEIKDMIKMSETVVAQHQRAFDKLEHRVTLLENIVEVERVRRDRESKALVSKIKKLTKRQQPDVNLSELSLRLQKVENTQAVHRSALDSATSYIDVLRHAGRHALLTIIKLSRSVWNAEPGESVKNSFAMMSSETFGHQTVKELERN